MSTAERGHVYIAGLAAVGMGLVLIGLGALTDRRRPAVPPPPRPGLRYMGYGALLVAGGLALWVAAGAL